MNRRGQLVVKKSSYLGVVHDDGGKTPEAMARRAMKQREAVPEAESRGPKDTSSDTADYDFTKLRATPRLKRRLVNDRNTPTSITASAGVE